MRLGLLIFMFASSFGCARGVAGAADRTEQGLALRFHNTVHPFLETYCFSCHGGGKQKGKLDLRPYSQMDAVIADIATWEFLSERLQSGEMPPEDARQHPSPELRKQVIEWFQDLRRHAARRNAGDPGAVLAHRLSNAEYDNTVRDLIGVNIRPAREFPVDPANESGFDNSGESLTVTPALLRKQLEAARYIADHLVLKPEGFAFAPHPVVTETDRDKFCVQRIIEFYQRQPTDLAEYFLAAWRYKHREVLHLSKTTMAELAKNQGISPRYLATVCTTLSDAKNGVGPLSWLRHMWNQLPAPGSLELQSSEITAREGCRRMRDFVVRVRERLKPEINNLSVRGIAPGSQPLVLWKDHQLAAGRRRYDVSALGKAAPTTAPHSEGDETLTPPKDPSDQLQYDQALDQFCSVFPDAFYVSERVLVFLKEDKESQGRLLSAGFHLMTGFFRDDAPLCDLILDSEKRQELDSLWQQLHFITGDGVRQYKDFIFFERAEPPRFMQGAEFDFARSEDHDAASATKMSQLAAAYLAKARRNGAEGDALTAIEDYFGNLSSEIRRVEEARRAAEPGHLQQLVAFGSRAYRRRLSQPESADLLSFYRQLRMQEQLTHEEALRDSIVSILVSPHFLFRGNPMGGVERVGTAVQAGNPAGKRSVRPLSADELATRLSYFLWASMPDAELLAHAQAGDLNRHSILLTQVRRMLHDPRSRGFATEFAAHWLDFRRFEEHNAVDRERFRSFNNELREAMFEEPIRFFLDVVRRDRSVLDFLYAKDTFVNRNLAAHYGKTDLHAGSNDWVRVEDADRFGRGGLLPMSVFLTMNAPGLRTSPVKRGYWVVRRLLGERIPPPPATVPELPSDEAHSGTLTLREMLARHRADKSCSGCHARFDAMGLVFEGYGPVGELRDRDLAGRPVDTHAIFPGGSEGEGLGGLRRYLHEHREQDFLNQLCRKLLVYALGRSLVASDDSLLDSMRTRLSAHGNRFSALVETIVASPQFLMRRDPEPSTLR